jgi:opacity protein-like surface antigen
MINKTKLVLGIATATITIAGVLVSPQAMAKKAKHSKVQTVEESSSSYSESKTSHPNNKIDALEAQLQAMQAEINSLRSQRPAPSADAGKVQELDQWMSDVKTGKAKVEAPKDHLFSVRGGWMHFNDNRNGTGTLAGALGTGGFNADRDASYYGGAIDFNVNNNLFGLMDHTSFGVEFGVEYAQIGHAKPNGVGGIESNVNQLRINASPKIKFMHGNKFRPWLIPAGLDINIISPPSNAITVLSTGMQFGAGAEYEVFRGIVVGADGRYHKAFNSIDGVDTDGFTLGGSVGFKF